MHYAKFLDWDTGELVPSVASVLDMQNYAIYFELNSTHPD